MNKRNKFTGMQGFYAILVGQLFSTIGSGMTRFGLGVWVLAETGDAAAYTTMLFFAVFPIGLGSLLGGPLIDRWNRRNIMIVGNVLASLSTLIIAILFFLDALALWQLYIALSINGVANAFILPTFEASTPLMVPKEHLERASGLNQMIRAFESILAPGFAGFLVGIFGLSAVLIVDFVTFGLSILALLMTHVPQPLRTTAPQVQSRYWGELISGFKYVRGQSAFIYLISLYTVTMFLLPGLGYSLAAPLILSFETEQVLGIIMAVFGVGSMVGGVLLAARRESGKRMTGILVSMCAAGVAAILISLRESVWLIGAGFFMTGLSFVFIVGFNRVILQTKVVPEMQGRVFALQAALGVGAHALGTLFAGPLAENIFEPLMASEGLLAGSVGLLIGIGEGRGYALMFLILGILQLLLVVGFGAIKSMREFEDEIPDVELGGADTVVA